MTRTSSAATPFPKSVATEDYTKTVSVRTLLGNAYNEELQFAFPDVSPGIRPCGYLLLCQIRTPKRRTASGIIFTDSTREDEKYRVQTALVRAMGPSAFRRRDNLEPWPEGAWCTPGTFIRAPMYGGDRFVVPYGKGDDEALFITIKDTDIIGVVEGDPLAVKTS